MPHIWTHRQAKLMLVILEWIRDAASNDCSMPLNLSSHQDQHACHS